MWRSIAPHDHVKMQLRQPPVGYKEKKRGRPGSEEGREREEATGGMGEVAPVHLDTNLTSSSSARFLGLLEQPDSDPYPNIEFDERDVVWSSSFSSASDLSSASSSPAAAGQPSYSPCESYRHRRPETRSFVPERSGLSAALAEDSLPLVRQRRPAAAAACGGTPVPVSAGRAGAEEAGGGMGMGKGFHRSAPVNVPVWPSWRRGEVENGQEEREEEQEEEEEEEDEEEKMVPPHVIVARSHVMTFSVFEGVGRTLKGRDLRRVRNAVLQKTGFL